MYNLSAKDFLNEDIFGNSNFRKIRVLAYIETKTNVAQFSDLIIHSGKKLYFIKASRLLKENTFTNVDFTKLENSYELPLRNFAVYGKNVKGIFVKSGIVSSYYYIPKDVLYLEDICIEENTFKSNIFSFKTDVIGSFTEISYNINKKEFKKSNCENFVEKYFDIFKNHGNFNEDLNFLLQKIKNNDEYTKQ